MWSTQRLEMRYERDEREHSSSISPGTSTCEPISIIRITEFPFTVKLVKVVFVTDYEDSLVLLQEIGECIINSMRSSINWSAWDPETRQKNLPQTEEGHHVLEVSGRGKLQMKLSYLFDGKKLRKAPQIQSVCRLSPASYIRTHFSLKEKHSEFKQGLIFCLSL